MTRAMNRFFYFVFCLFSCGNFDNSGKGKDVPTAGNLELWVDQGDSLVLTQLKELFEQNYPKAKIKLIYASETAILKAVNEENCRACVMHRDFDSLEKTALENRDFKVRSVKIAVSSSAVLANKKNVLTEISLDDLAGILSNQKTAINSNIQVIFDQAGGSNYRLFRWFFNNRKVVFENAKIRSLPTPEAVLRRLQSDENAIGVVNVNLIADRSDPSSTKWLDSLKVLKIQSLTDGNFVYPFQSQISAGQYPFVSGIYFHDLQGYSGLASGFQAWIYSQPGQILIKKSGLLPARDQGRTIEIGTE